MAYAFNAAGNGGAPFIVPVGGPPGRDGPKGGDSTVPGPEGPRGRDGTQGPAGAGAISSREATTDIAPWTALIPLSGNKCAPADPGNPSHQGQVIGVTSAGGASGTQVLIQNVGDLVGASGNFQAGQSLFVGSGGVLTAEAPTSGWRQIVATAAAASQIVVLLGEASTINNETAMLAGGGFATPCPVNGAANPSAEREYVTPQANAVALSGKLDQSAKASQSESVSGRGDATYTTPDSVRRHVLTRIGVSPYDFITDPAAQEAIRTGINPPACDDAFQQFLNAWIASAGDCGATATVPAGTWVFDAAREAMLFSPGRNRKFHLHFSPDAKLVPSPNNRFRYAVQGSWDAAANPNLISTSSGVTGDVWTVITPANNLSLNGITNVNVGDQVYKGVNGWQKILCRANYRYQFWDASTNQDDKGNLVILPSIGDEYDCMIVGKAGTSNIDGVASWAVGDEIIYIRGKWRKKKVQGGNFRGTWNAHTNTPTLSNAPSSGTVGDWYVIDGPGFTYAPINLGNGNTTGLGEFVTTFPGEKIWCVAPGKWQKCYASPTPRQTWEPATDNRICQWYPATASAASTNTFQPGTKFIEPLSSRGGYGDLYEVTVPGTGTVGSITRDWKRGEFAYFGANGWELIQRDPNWDRGLFLFWHDDKTSLEISGSVKIVPQSKNSELKEWSEGWYFRNYSLQRAGYFQYLFQSEMLKVERLVLAGDDANPQIAQNDQCICEGIWETKTLYKPAFNRVDILVPNTGGPTRSLEVRNYPRLLMYGIRHLDGYIPNCYDFDCNGALNRAYALESDCWSVEQASWEGGYLRVMGANMMTAAYITHGLRAMPTLFEPTFEIDAGDLSFARYGVHIRGHQGVNLKVGRALLPGIGGTSSMIEQPSFIMLEECSDIHIHTGVPTSGFFTDFDRFCAFLKTRGGVFNVVVEGADFGDMTGVIFNLRHNANTASPYPFGYGTGEYKVAVRNCSEVLKDASLRKVFYPSVSKDLVKGAEWLMPSAINPDLWVKAADHAAAASSGVPIGGAYLDSATGALRFRTV